MSFCVYFLSEGGGSLREPEKRGHTGQTFQECRDRLGGSSGLWRCHETPGTFSTYDTLLYTLRTVRLNEYLHNNLIYLILVQPNSLLLSNIYSYSFLGEILYSFP